MTYLGALPLKWRLDESDASQGGAEDHEQACPHAKTCTLRGMTPAQKQEHERLVAEVRQLREERDLLRQQLAVPMAEAQALNRDVEVRESPEQNQAAL